MTCARIRAGRSPGVTTSTRNPKQVLKSDLQTAKIEQGRAWKWVHQQIKITALLVGTVQDGTEDTGIDDFMSRYQIANPGVM